MCAASSVAVAGALSQPLLFVLVLYSLPRHITALPRNTPSHIQWRMCGIALVCAIAPFISLITLASLRPRLASTPTALLAVLGVHPVCNGSVYALVTPLLAWILLFLGPLTAAALTGCHMLRARALYAGAGGNGSGSVTNAYEARCQWWMNVRDLLFAPFAEEWVFRACVLPCFLAAGFGHTAAVWLTAATFALAHLHHALEARRQGTPWRTVGITLAAQATYTTLFGALTAYFYLHDTSLLAIVASHAFCNLMGAPDLAFMQRGHLLYNKRVLIGVAYVLGIAGFTAAAVAFPRAAFPCSLHHMYALEGK